MNAQKFDDSFVIRHATLSDIDGILRLIDEVHNISSLTTSARDFLTGLNPTINCNDFVIVTDKQANDLIVAVAGLLRQTWAYEGIAFNVGIPEFITTAPTYRRRGIMRRLINHLHSYSAARGDFAQAILGIRWFYRQFGYEYALLPGLVRSLDLVDVPLSGDDQAKQLHIRRSTEADIPQINQLYRHSCAGKLIINVLDHNIRVRDIIGYSSGSDLGDWTYLITNKNDQFVGYFSTWGDPWGAFTIKELAAITDDWLPLILPSVLQFVQHQTVTYKDSFEDSPPTHIDFELSSSHPAIDLLPTLQPAQPRQNWYLRIDDLPQFIMLIAPVLEARLQRSALAGYSDTLSISFFEGGLKILFQNGKLQDVTDWSLPSINIPLDIPTFPPLVFLKLLFGYRSLEELHFAYPDCWANEEKTQLLNILFPKQESWLRML